MDKFTIKISDNCKLCDNISPIIGRPQWTGSIHGVLNLERRGSIVSRGNFGG